MSRTKKHSVLTVLLSLVLLVFAVSCNSEAQVPSAGRTNVESASPEDALVYYYISRDYKMTDSQVESALSDALGFMDGSSGTLTRQASHDYEMAYAEGAKGLTDEYSLTFYDYEIQTEGQGVRHALVTNDRRIGPVLCVVDGELDRSMFFIDAFLEAASMYADSIGDSWSAITEEDVSAFREKYSGATEDSKLVSYFWLSEPVADPGYDFDAVLSSEWGQENPFNLAVQAYLGHNYPVGCANLAVAMICSKYNYPTSISDNNILTSLQSHSFNIWNGWNGEIAWDKIHAMDETENGWEVENSQPEAGDQTSAVASLSAFLLELGQKTKSVYGTSGTGTDVGNVLSVLSNMGYTMDKSGKEYGGKVYDWSFENIRSSLSNGRPVLAYDVNHMFIVDGMFRGTSDLYPVLGWYVAAEPVAKVENMRYVHMNFGWNGYFNGWYNENLVKYALGIIEQDAEKDPGDYGYPKVPTGLILNLRPAQ